MKRHCRKLCSGPFAIGLHFTRTDRNASLLSCIVITILKSKGGKNTKEKKKTHQTKKKKLKEKRNEERGGPSYVFRKALYPIFVPTSSRFALVRTSV